jgi:hypothetical protein
METKIGSLACRMDANQAEMKAMQQKIGANQAEMKVMQQKIDDSQDGCRNESNATKDR